MATTSTATPSGSVARGSQSGLFLEIRAFVRQFITAAFDPYRPELHYMRGPGPACRAKRTSRD